MLTFANKVKCVKAIVLVAKVFVLMPGAQNFMQAKIRSDVRIPTHPVYSGSNLPVTPENSGSMTFRLSMTFCQSAERAIRWKISAAVVSFPVACCSFSFDMSHLL